MTDWAPQVVIIEKVIHHPDADALDVCTVLGDYPVIVKRDEYKEGDIALYLPIDTIVPDIQTYYFLCPKAYERYEGDYGEVLQRMIGPKYPLGQVPEKYRILKAKKIRGIYSQGLLLQQGACCQWFDPLPQLGDLLTDPKFDMGLKKWEEIEEDNLPTIKSRGANQAPAPKGWAIPHYDIDSVRKYLSCVEGEQDVILTEKLHGSNAGFCHDGTSLVVKSRNFYKRKDEEDMWWDVALRYDLENKLAKFPMLVFFGECIGNVKGFRYNAEIVDGKLHTKLYFFDVWDTKKLRFLDYDQFVATIAEADLETTPLLYRGPWTNKEEMYAHADGMTMLGGKHIKEGWVLSLGHERYESKLDSRCKLKYVSEAYNLQK